MTFFRGFWSFVVADGGSARLADFDGDKLEDMELGRVLRKPVCVGVDDNEEPDEEDEEYEPDSREFVDEGGGIMPPMRADARLLLFRFLIGIGGGGMDRDEVDDDDDDTGKDNDGGERAVGADRDERDEMPPLARWAEFMAGNDGGVSSSSESEALSCEN